MKLTNFHRAAFVKSVMNDLPKIDYDEDFKKIVEQDMLDSAPTTVKALLQDKANRGNLFHYGRIYPSSISNKTSSLNAVAVFNDFTMSSAAKKKAIEVLDKARLQDDALSSMCVKVRGSINAFTTVKSAVAAMPEFAKYLPQEAEKTANSMLPALANLTADLIKMGWPKTQAAVAA